MSGHELRSIEVLSEVLAKRRTEISAAAILGFSTMQMRRLVVAYRVGGGGAMIHKARGRTFARAIEAFNATLGSDPSCSIVYWGIALSNWGNPFVAGLKPQAQLEQGLKAVQQARAASPKTERERAYVEAVAHLFTDTAETSHDHTGNNCFVHPCVQLG
jgi:hypothetical protein